MNGKGDRNRTSDYEKYRAEYDKIDWGKDAKKDDGVDPEGRGKKAIRVIR